LSYKKNGEFDGDKRENYCRKGVEKSNRDYSEVRIWVRFIC